MPFMENKFFCFLFLSRINKNKNKKQRKKIFVFELLANNMFWEIWKNRQILMEQKKRRRIILYPLNFWVWEFWQLLLFFRVIPFFQQIKWFLKLVVDNCLCVCLRWMRLIYCTWRLVFVDAKQTNSVELRQFRDERQDEGRNVDQEMISFIFRVEAGQNE